MPEPPDPPLADDLVAHPHDRYFRAELQGRAEQVALVTALFPALVGTIDPASFIAIDGTFVDEELRERQSDLVLQMRVAGQETLLYVVIEHQRTVDPLMAVRLHRYQGRVWDRFLNEHPGARWVPPIIPAVIYSGGRRWNAPRDVRDTLRLDDATAAGIERYLPRQEYRLEDLTDLDPDVLTPPLRVLLRLLVSAPGAVDVDRLLSPLHPDFVALYAGPWAKHHLAAAFRYIIAVSNIPTQSLRPFATGLGRTAEEVLMTTAERLREEGRVENQVATLVRLLTSRFGRLPSDVERRVRTASFEQRDLWLDRILTETTLDEVLS